MRYILFLWGDLWFCTYNWYILGHNCAVGGIWIWIKDFLCLMFVFPLKHTGNILQITKWKPHLFVEMFCLWVWLSLSEAVTAVRFFSYQDRTYCRVCLYGSATSTTCPTRSFYVWAEKACHRRLQNFTCRLWQNMVTQILPTKYVYI